MNIISIIIAIIIFSIIILFHELGHFLLAKSNGIRVNEFSLGLGPTLFGLKKGETRYSLKLLPFGGACMMEGEDEESDDARSFYSKSVWARISVVAAGPVFNFIMAFLLSVILIGSIGVDLPVLSGVMEDYPAEAAGMKEGDEIVRLDQKRILCYREISMYLYYHDGEEVNVTYKRDGQTMQTVLKPKYNEESGRYLVGFLSNSARTKLGIGATLRYSVHEVKYWIESTIKGLGMLVTGRASINDMSGPVGIVRTIGETYTESVKQSGHYLAMMNMLNMSILLSANLGVMNLLPIPALDGGRLLFLIIEAIRRKRIDANKEGFVHFVGLMILLGLMALVLFNDVRKIIP